MAVFMSLRSKLNKLLEISECFVHQPGLSRRLLGQLPIIIRGSNYSQHWESSAAEHTPPLFFSEYEKTAASTKNPLKAFFDSRETGRGCIRPRKACTSPLPQGLPRQVSPHASAR